MTHPKNYEYVKKWRENNKELNLLRGIKYSTKYYCFKRQQPFYSVSIHRYFYENLFFVVIITFQILFKYFSNTPLTTTIHLVFYRLSYLPHYFLSYNYYFLSIIDKNILRLITPRATLSASAQHNLPTPC